MAIFTEFVENLAARKQPVPQKYTADVPRIFEPGPFSAPTKTQEWEPGVASGDLPLQKRMRDLLRQMQSLDHSLRNLKFGDKVQVPDEHRPTGKIVPSSHLRGEITKWHEKCQMLEHELRMNKASRHTPGIQVEHLTRMCDERDEKAKHIISKTLRLEREVETLRSDIANLRRDCDDLKEKSQKMTNEKIPHLDRMNAERGTYSDAVDTLTADAETLCSMFRRQADENKKRVRERDDLLKELSKVQTHLRLARDENQFQVTELQKKETLHLRTMEARQATHESYLNQKKAIMAVEAEVQRRDADWQTMVEALESREREIRGLNEELFEASQKIDKLEQQKKECLKKIESDMGKQYNPLLEQLKADLNARHSSSS